MKEKELAKSEATTQETENKNVAESQGESKKKTSVRLGNFVVTDDDNTGIITVAAISGEWYLGFGVTTLAAAFLRSILFTQSEPSEDDLNIAHVYITSLFSMTQIVNGDFTVSVYGLIDEFMKRESAQLVGDADSEKSQEENKQALSAVEISHTLASLKGDNE